MKRGIGVVLAALVLIVLDGCGNRPPPPLPAQPVQAGPKPGKGIGIYKVGEPYQVNGVWYYPTQDLNYDETGIAAWYGPDFHESYTANGEPFDENAAAGASKVLPLPSIVQVTNLDNGRSIQVRINDRGPYNNGRIVDLTHRAAQMLGFDQQGTAKVRLRVMVPETVQAQSLAKLNDPTPAGQLETPPPAVPNEVLVAQALPPPTAAQPAPQAAPAAAPRSQPSPSPALGEDGKPVPPGPPLSNAVTVMPVHPTQIYIQAGAFTSSANAERMKAKLAGVGPVGVYPVHVNGMYVFRVRIGPIATVDAADNLLSRATGAGANDAQIVID